MLKEPLDDDFTFLLNRMIGVFNRLRDLDQTVNKIKVNEKDVLEAHRLYEIVYKLQENDWGKRENTAALRDDPEKLFTAPPTVMTYTIKTMDMVKKFYRERHNANAVQAMDALIEELKKRVGTPRTMEQKKKVMRTTTPKRAMVPYAAHAPTVPPSPTPSPPALRANTAHR